MSPNDLIAQQQALLQNAQNLQFIYIAGSLASLLVTAWVLSMFYTRLRDIADELRKLRVTYEMEQDRTTRRAVRPPPATSAENPLADDARFKPAK